MRRGTPAARDRFVRAMLVLCEKKDINKISVRDVLEESGAARQTFYNCYHDINDLILDVPFALAETCDEGLYTQDACTALFCTARQERGYFGQLPHHTGQNCFRDSYLNKLKEIYYHSVFHGSPCEIAAQKAQIDAYIYGVVDLFMEWCATGMQDDPQWIAAVIFSMKPPFMTEDPLPDYCAHQGAFSLEA